MRTQGSVGLVMLSALVLAAAMPMAGEQRGADAAARERVMTAMAQMPLYFVENQGQIDGPVSFYIQGSDKTIYFTPQGITFLLAGGDAGLAGTAVDGLPKPRSRWVVKLDFVGANPNACPVGEVKAEAVFSYFTGSQDQWHAGLPSYHRIVYRDLWAGIDLAYYGTVNEMKYEFIVHPGADPSRIRLAYSGATDVCIAETGALEVSTPEGGVTDGVPVAYQERDGARSTVSVAYAMDTDEADGTQAYRFHVGTYDTARPLVIDPVILVYCGYIGGSAADQAFGVAVDTSGNAYVTGTTESTQATFPAFVGPDLTFNGTNDVFVAKVPANGASLAYCGYIGGSSIDVGRGIAVDAAGNAYVTGYTNSSQALGFPVLVGPDLTHNGNADGFVAKVRADGTGLIYCGYIGGGGADRGNGIAVDAAGNAYIVGDTYSSPALGFPVVVGPDLTYEGPTGTGTENAFVAKVQATGAALTYCGYIGGTGGEFGYGIAVDGSGCAYVTGYTTSTQAQAFPLAVGPDLTHNGGTYDAFVAKVQASGISLAYCGYIGGSGSDVGQGIAVDAAGNAYVAGYTSSTETTFPVAVGPDLTQNGSFDAFVAKVQASGAGLTYCGFIGGSTYELGTGIAIDAAGNAYVTGYTDSTEATFPVATGPDITFNGGTYDAFVAKIPAGGTSLDYCGYIGGATIDQGHGIAVDGSGNAYVTGNAYSTQTTFPVNVGPDLTQNGGCDAFVAKIAPVTGALYVDAVRPDDSGNGLSWATAKKTIQAAINLGLAGDEVWVKAGTYNETRTADPNGSLVLKSDVGVYGGFGGAETARDQRNWNSNPTIITGMNGRGAGLPGGPVVKALVSACTLDGFTVRDGFGGITGGIWINALGAHITNCIITNNSGVAGGGMLCDNASGADIVNCLLQYNSASFGGGMQIQPGRTVSLVNGLFVGNTSGADGGGIRAHDGAASVTVMNCSFFDNTAGTVGGAISGACAVTNSILWGDTPNEGAVNGLNGPPTISYSDVQGGYAGTGNINADPLFVNSGGGDYRLQAGSPCIDTAGSTGAPSTDLDGNPRPVDVPGVGGSGANSYDMGAYEGQGYPPIAPTSPGSMAASDSITWTWNDNSSDETGFKVYDDPGAGPPATLQTTTGADVVQWQHGGLTPNTQYALQVAATNASGDSTKTTNYAAWTLIEAVSGLEFTPTTTSISVSSVNMPSNLSSGTSGLYFENTTVGTNSGWQQDNTPWLSGVLTPNTQYAFSGKSRNGDSAETTADIDSTYTLTGPPSAGNNVSCDKALSTLYPADTVFTFNNPAGFGAGTHGASAYVVSKFKYVWDTSAAYAFAGAEPDWNAGILPQGPTASGAYYLHLQSFNADDVAGGTLDYGPFEIDVEAPVGTPGLVSSSPTGAVVITFSVAFSKPVAPTFTAADVAVTGTLSGTLAISGADPAYTVSVTLASQDADGTVGITVAGAGAVTDLAGNPYAGGSSPLCSIYNWRGFTSEPQDTNGYVGEDYTMSVTPNCGASTITYQWKWDDGMKAVHDGPTTSTWVLTNVSAGNAGEYWCEVSYDGATYATRHGALLVEDHLQIAGQPEGGNRTTGESHTFTVVPTGGYAPLIYQWKKDGALINNATNASYTIVTLSISDSGAFTVDISDDNTDSRTSNEAVLTVSEGVPATGRAGLAMLAVACIALGAMLTLHRATGQRRL